MTDLFSPFILNSWIGAIISITQLYEKITWFWETKYPIGLDLWLSELPKNSIISTTIETNKRYDWKVAGLAPPPELRYKTFKELPWEHKHISVEPVMAADFDVLLKWFSSIDGLKQVSVGYDNYNNRLPEPPKAEVEKFIENLKAIGLEVEIKTLRPAWWER